jgi:hypothetical protein
MKSRLHFAMPVAAVLMAGCAINSRAQTVTEVCNSASDTIQGSPYQDWRFTVTIASSTVALQTRTLDLWLNLGSFSPTVVSGQLYSGITEQSIDFINTPNSPIGTGNCVGYAQTFSVLAKNGAPYGTRIGQYIILASDTYVPCCGGRGYESLTVGPAKGFIQFTDYDLSGNVLSVASGTFTGVTPNIPSIDNTDPFWSLTPQ